MELCRTLKRTEPLNWVEEDLSKFPVNSDKQKTNKKTLKRQSKGHVFVKQVCFSYGPLPLRELHSTDETLVWRDPGGS